MSIVEEYEDLLRRKNELIDRQEFIIKGYEANADNLEKNFGEMMKIINKQDETIQLYNSQVIRLLAMVDRLGWWLSVPKWFSGLFNKKDSN